MTVLLGTFELKGDAGYMVGASLLRKERRQR